MRRGWLIGWAAIAASSVAGLVLAQEQPSDRQAPAAPAAAPTAPAPAAAAASDDPVAAVLPPEEAAPPAADKADVETTPVAPPAPAKPPEPLKRPRYTTAVLQAVDKITAETLRFEARVGEPVRYKGLVLTVHACETTAEDEGFSDSIAHLQILSEPEAAAGRAAVAPREVYRGWMFASSPGLHPVENPGYDVWLIACRTDAPSPPGGKA